MKNMKKIASLLLALALVFSLSFTVTAADGDTATGSITVVNPKADQEYTAYKIFDAVKQSGENKYSYSIEKTSEWFDVVATVDTDGKVTPNFTGLLFTKEGDTDKYLVEKTDDFSAPNFAAFLKEKTEGKKGTKLIVSGGTAKATNLDLGYYFVTSTTGALCNLTTTSPEAHISDKNDVPFEKTDDNTNSAEIGQVINYTITGKVPDTTGFDTYTYKISDTMTEGLTFNNTATVKIGGVEINDKYTFISKDNGFELTINVKEFQAQVGAEIKVTYSATVNENAVKEVQNNRATLEYSNNPANDASTTISPPVEEPVFSAKIVIDKYDAGDSLKKLGGAEFLLYKIGDGNAKLYYQYTPADDTANTAAKVDWVSDSAQATKTVTDTDGAAEFKGLKEGTYYLEETEAPDGYNKLTAPEIVTINGENQMTLTVKVPNGNGSLLPEAGGMGTYLFYILGGALVAAAAGLMIAKRRGNNESK